MMHVAPQEWRNHASAKDSVPVRLRHGVPPRVKVGSYFLCRNRSDGRRQQSVECPLKLAGAQLGMSFEICDLIGRMNARVRASGALNLQPLLCEILEDIAQRALDGLLSRLNLPPAEIGSVVGQSELDVMHGHCAQLSHACGQSPANAYFQLIFEI